MTKVLRLTGLSAFRALFEAGKKIHHPLLFIVVKRGSTHPPRRLFGCNVLSQVKGSVVRNRLKRRLREIYLHHQASMVQDMELMVMAKVPSVKASYQELEAAFVATAKRAGLFT